MHWSPLHNNRYRSKPWRRWASKAKRVLGVPHYNAGNQPNHLGVKTVPKCATCGAELEPPVRAPHTVYAKSLYRISGQDYCRHHIIGAAVAAGEITEIRSGGASGASASLRE